VSLRDEMPVTAEFIDDFRAAFGVDEINEQIRRGMRGETTFYAQENGHEIGRRDPREGVIPAIFKPVVIASGKAQRG